MAGDNPLIVFVVPESVGKRGDDFPIGWRMDGKFDSPALLPEESYSVMFLDDTRQVPNNISFANKDREGRLLIVAHASSTTNSDPTNNPVLQTWGKPYVCKRYSRLRSSEVWQAIQSLALGDPATLANFVKTQRNDRNFDLYDQLAAICQLNIIDPSAESENLASTIILEFPVRFQNEFWKQSDWFARLECVRKEAAPITND